ncbi:hypothetical protein BGX26_005782 [Mortierella sp. AD094]|nr:hypothetical protein BGX26_005782 [Mortierella sp. AD094]
MSSNTHIPLFQIPELVTMIAEYLILHDIATLSISCKSLNQLFKPSLWKNVVINKNKPEHMSLLENRQHIRTLHIKGLHESMLDILASATQPSEPNNSISLNSSCIINTFVSTIPAMTNLQKLTILSEEREKIYFLKASIILRQSPRLVQLRFPISWFLDYEDQFLYILSNELPHLMEIYVSGGYSIQKQQSDSCWHYGFGIYFGCYNDRSLNELLTSSTPAENKMDSTVVSSPQSKIATIRLNRDRPNDYQRYPASFLIRNLLNHCPYLEQFEAPQLDIFHKGTRETYPGILCLNLQHITFTVSDWTAKEFINFIIEECAKGTGLKFCQLDFPSKNTFYANETLDNLAQHHSGTLEDFEILDSLTMCSEGVRSVLESSENLKRLCNGHMFFNTDCNELVRCDWACSNLKTLSLEVILTSSIHMADGGAWRVPEKLFSQIGRLTELETLAPGWVDCNGGPNRKKELVKRCLDQLGNPSNLRQFQMLTSCWSPIGQDEIELIYNSWLPLRRVIFRRHEQFLSKQPHWQWLQERRLGLQFNSS